MNKIKIFLVAAALLLSGQTFAQTTKATIQGEISISTANGLLGGTILNNIVLSYVDWTTCSGTGGIVYWNAGIPTCLNAGTNGYTLTMVSGIPQWTLPASQSANTVYAGPSSGSPAIPSFRALVGSDLPNPSASTLGGVQSAAAVSHQWINSISTSGVPQLSQPAFTDISGTLGLSTGGTGATSAANAIINLMPTPSRAGDIAYWNGTNWVTLPGNNSGSQYLNENASGVPSWAASSTAGVSSLNALTGAVTVTAGAGITVTTSSNIAVAVKDGYTSNTTCTITDQSGASLSITTNYCTYSTTNNTVTVIASISYPSTASGANALISLPVAVPNHGTFCSGVPFNVGGGVLALGAATCAITNTSTAGFYSLANGNRTANSTLSAGTFTFSLTYPAT